MFCSKVILWLQQKHLGTSQITLKFQWVFSVFIDQGSLVIFYFIMFMFCFFCSLIIYIRDVTLTFHLSNQQSSKHTCEYRKVYHQSLLALVVNFLCETDLSAKFGEKKCLRSDGTDSVTYKCFLNPWNSWSCENYSNCTTGFFINENVIFESFITN